MLKKRYLTYKNQLHFLDAIQKQAIRLSDLEITTPLSHWPIVGMYPLLLYFIDNLHPEEIKSLISQMLSLLPTSLGGEVPN